MNIIFAVIHCPPIPVWDDIEVNTSDRAYQTYVNVTCIDGTTLDNGEMFMVVHCSHTREWVPAMKECKCNFN